MEKPDHICLIKHEHFRTHSHGTSPIFSGHYQNLKGLSLSRRYIYKFQIFHFLLNNFPSSGNVTKNIIWRYQVFYLFVCDNRNQSGVKQAAWSSEKNCDDE